MQPAENISYLHTRFIVSHKMFMRGISSVVLFLLLISTALGAPTGGIRGTVTSDGAPLVGAEVKLLELNRTTHTDQNGAFEFRSVPEGSYQVFVRMLGYESMTKDLSVQQDVVRLDLPLEENPITGEEVVISAYPYGRTADQLYQSAESRVMEELQSKPGSSFAEKLADVPGVGVRYNGSAPARPVIRGLSDERVLMLENGLRTGDLSTFDPAHAVPVEPNTISQIDVVRGPSSILYGPNTIGGLVNVLTNIVPSSVNEGLSGTALLSGNSVSDEYAGSVHATYGTGNNALSFSFGGNHAQDLRVPTNTFLDQGSGQAFIFDRMPASYHRTTSISAGYLFDNSEQSFGVGYKNFSTTYGVPGIPPDVSKLIIDKNMVELHTALHFNDSFAKGLQLSGNYSDFSQNERPSEADSLGVVQEVQGNQFKKKGVNAMLQFLHHPIGGVEGTFGLWFLREDLSGVGDEILSPDAVSTGFAMDVLEEYPLSPQVRAQVGLRYDFFNIQTSPNAVFTVSDEHRMTNSFSASGGLLWKADEHWTTSLTLSRSFRPPTVLELFSNGVDAPTSTFDIGEPTLDPETGAGIDLGIKGSFASLSFEVSPYVNFINDYIYGYLTGAVDSASGLDVRKFAATDARLVGFEASADIALTKHVGLLISGDYVEAEDTKANQPLPFTPPFKGLVRLSYVGPLSADVEMRAAADQTRLGIGDTPTPGFAVFNAGCSLRLIESSTTHTISIRVDNIFDRLYRDHLSVIKDFMPMPGRGARLSYLVSF